MRESIKKLFRQTDYEIDILERYISFTEQFLQDESAKNLKREVTEDDGEYIFDYVTKNIELKGLFPQILRKSALVTLYSLGEKRLNLLCELIEKEEKLPSSLTDIKKPDQSIRRARRYLIEVAGITFSDSLEWKKFLAFQKLRNSIVHNDGIIESTVDNVNFMVNLKHPGIFFYLFLGAPYRRLVINHLFFEDAIGTLRSFFKNLEKSF